MNVNKILYISAALPIEFQYSVLSKFCDTTEMGNWGTHWEAIAIRMENGSISTNPNDYINDLLIELKEIGFLVSKNANAIEISATN